MLSHRLDTALTAGDLLASNVNASLKKANVTCYRVGMREASTTKVPLVSPHVIVLISWGVSIDNIFASILTLIPLMAG